MNRTSIEWTDYTTNLIRYRDPEGRSVHGCIKVSAGCANCYASAWSARGLTGERGGAFTAKRQATLTPSFDEAEGKRILRTKVTGKRVFVGDMTDVFGEWVPDALLDRMFAVFALRPDLTFQVLTKRPERMRAYFDTEDVWARIEVQERKLHHGGCKACRQADWNYKRRPHLDSRVLIGPLSNVWLGVSVEDQAAADERIPDLLDTPAAVRFLSCEPLLGPVKLTPVAIPRVWGVCYPRETVRDVVRRFGVPMVDWVIAGGESGSGARPCAVDWIRDIVGQCRAAEVPVFVKQLGRRPYDDLMAPGWAAEARGYPAFAAPWVPEFGANWAPRLTSRKGSNPDEWPEDLRVREFPS